MSQELKCAVCGRLFPDDEWVSNETLARMGITHEPDTQILPFIQQRVDEYIGHVCQRCWKPEHKERLLVRRFGAPPEPPASGDSSTVVVHKKMWETPFRAELERLINRHSMENGSNTPDFILAQFLEESLTAFDKAVKRRDEWKK